jgi:4-hydroxy-3-methylbut-2-en-1-yl diphosphate synthase IspG/GcpE
MRIGVNAGSLERDLLETVRRALPEAMVGERASTMPASSRTTHFFEFKISVKALRRVPRRCDLSESSRGCGLSAPNLGITEAGGLRTGTIKCRSAWACCCGSGIGRTIRVSLSATGRGAVKAATTFLKSLGCAIAGVNVIACPVLRAAAVRRHQDVAAVEARLAHSPRP